MCTCYFEVVGKSVSLYRTCDHKEDTKILLKTLNTALLQLVIICNYLYMYIHMVYKKGLPILYIVQTMYVM